MRRAILFLLLLILTVAQIVSEGGENAVKYFDTRIGSDPYLFFFLGEMDEEGTRSLDWFYRVSYDTGNRVKKVEILKRRKSSDPFGLGTTGNDKIYGEAAVDEIMLFEYDDFGKYKKIENKTTNHVIHFTRFTDSAYVFFAWSNKESCYERGIIKFDNKGRIIEVGRFFEKSSSLVTCTYSNDEDALIMYDLGGLKKFFFRKKEGVIIGYRYEEDRDGKVFISDWP